MGDLGLIPWLGRSPGGGHGNPGELKLRNFNLRNLRKEILAWRISMDRGAWRSMGLKELDMTEQLSTAQSHS